MKLARLALLLLVANLGFFAWNQGWLDSLAGLRAEPDREPERAARQFQPHLLRVIPTGAAASAASASASAPAAEPATASAPGNGGQAEAACLEAGPFTAAEATAAEALLQPALPAASWSRRSVEQPGVWILYVGRFIAADARQKKVDELQRLKVPFSDVTSPPDLAPGLSLGSFDNRAAADQALDALSQRGVRGARVVVQVEPSARVALRVERADAALADKLRAITGSVAGQPLGRAFRPC